MSKLRFSFTVLMIYYSLLSQAQVLPSSCSTNDSLFEIFKGYAGQITRKVQSANRLPSNDSLWLDQALVDRITKAQIAIYNCDSLFGRDSIYDDLSNIFLDSSFVNAPIRRCSTNRVYYDTSSIYYKQLLLDSMYSGDPVYDSLAKHMGLKVIFFDNMFFEYSVLKTGKGFYNYEKLFDSLESLSWIRQAQVAESYCDHMNYEQIVLFSGDTTYIQYAYHWDTDGFSFNGNRYWNYVVYPNCSVQYLGGISDDLVFPMTYANYSVDICADSVNLEFDSSVFNKRTYVWSTGRRGASTTVFGSGDYWLLSTSKSNSLDRIFIDYKVNLYVKSNAKLIKDSVICQGEEIQLDSNDNSTVLHVLDEQKEPLDSPYLVNHSAMYFLSMPNCGIIDSQYYQYIPKADLYFTDTIYKCRKDTVVLAVSSEFDSTLWSNGLSKTQIKVTEENKYYVTTYKEVCKWFDSTNVFNFNSKGLDLGRDTIIDLNHSLLFQIPTEYSSIRWEDSSGNRDRTIYANNLGVGTHELWCDVVDSFGCSSSDTIKITVKDFVNIGEQLSKGLIISPNPTSGKIDIVLQSNIKRVSIFNAQGHLIEAIELKGFRTYTIDLVGSSGLFYIEVSSDDGTFFRKKVVKY